jgi:hypothetical protein
MSETTDKRVMIAKRPFRIGWAQVEDVMTGVLPEPISSHFVVVGQRRYPPKQVIGELTGLDRADFTTHQARRVLMNLGFAAGRKPRLEPARVGADPRSQPASRVPRPPAAELSTDGGLTAMLRELPGQWVATKGDELLVAASTPHAVVSWLAQQHLKADSMFRVPEDELAASGLAPL